MVSASSRYGTIRHALAVFALAPVSVVCLCFGNPSAEDKPAEKPELPRIQMAVPFAVASGTTTKIVLRGWKADQASEAKLSLDSASAKILNKGGSPVPNGQDAKQIGDQQVEIELTLPQEAAAGELEISLTTPSGTSAPYRLTLIGATPDIPEKEPNDGFENGQPLELPGVVQGQIDKDRDVDVYTFTANAGEKLNAKMLARVHGSGLDSLLTLFDAAGNVVAINDDTTTSEGKNSADAELKLPLPATGLYRLVLQDAHDHGGPAHPYRLRIRLEKE